MEITTLRVEVDRRQLDGLIARVDALNKRTIRFEISRTASKNLTNLGDAADKTASRLKAFDDQVQDSKKQISKLTDAERRYIFQGKETRDILWQNTRAMRDYTSAQKEGAKAQEAGGKATRQAAEDQKKLKPALDDTAKSASGLFATVQKFATWYFTAGLVTKLTGAVKDALGTMKEVDGLLTSIQKVTGQTDGEIAALGEKAYSAASDFGVAATSYLESSSDFAKAGYENYTQLAELATKTQLVGDVTSHTANQFLLSADAAWKFRGSVESLSAMLDKANTIENNYATSISKLAEGFPNVASVSASANMSPEEALAALGTITAATQESGSKASYALRALILNIFGEVGAQIDELTETSEGSVAAMQEAMQKYAADALAAAKATGEVLNPMEAIRAISQSYRDGLMTETELLELASNVGGKMRSNQLTALIKNFDMYESMLEDMKTAAGSADKEVEIMLSSWDSKVKVLQNSWTELVSHMADTGTIKGGLDLVIGAVQLLDTDFGRLVITVTGAAVAFKLLSAGVGKLKTAVTSSGAWEGLSYLFKNVTSGAITAGDALKGLALNLAHSPAAWLALGMAIFEGTKKLLEWDDGASRAIERIQELDGQISESESQLDSLNDKLEENQKLLAESEKAGGDSAYLERLKLENIELERQIKLEKLKLENARREKGEQAEAGLTDNRFWVSQYNGALNRGSILEEFSHYLEGAKASGSDQYDGKLAELAGDIQTLRESLDQTNESQLGLYVATGNLIDQYLALTTGTEYVALENQAAAAAMDAFRQTMEKTEAGGKRLSKSQKELGEAADQAADSLDGESRKLQENQKQQAQTIQYLMQMEDTYSTVTAAQKESAEAGSLSAKTLQAINEKYPDLLEYLTETKDGYILTAESANKYLEANRQIVTGADQVINASKLKAAGYDVERMSIEELLRAMQQLYAMEMYERAQDVMAANKSLPTYQRKSLQSDPEYAAAESKWHQIQGILQNVSSYDKAAGILSQTSGGASTGGSSGGGSSGGSRGSGTGDKQLEGYQNRVSLLESELTLLQKQGAPAEKLAAKQKEIQQALHAQAEYLRSIGAEQTEINALSAKWWDIQNDILSLQKQQRQEIIDQAEEIIRKGLEQAEEIRDGQLAALEKEKKALEDQRDAEKEKLSLEEKQLAVEKARAALEDARRERTVRYYNAKTGQWEWGADRNAVQQAENELKQAEQDLKDYQAQLEYQAALEAIEAKKDAINAAYTALKAGWEKVIESLQDPAADIGAILRNVKNITLPEFRRQIEKVGDSLEGLADELPVKFESLFGGLNGKLQDQLAKLSGGISSAVSGAVSGIQDGISEAISSMQEAISKQLSQYSPYGGKYMSWEDAEDLKVQGEFQTVPYEVLTGQKSFEEWLREAGLNKDSIQRIPEDEDGITQDIPDGYKGLQSGGLAGARDEDGEYSYKRRGDGNGDDPDAFFMGDKDYEKVSDLEKQLAEAKKNGWTEAVNEIQKQQDAIREKYGYSGKDGQPIMAKKYDRGGILKGLGGIKATQEDEMILPPDVTRSLLRPAADSLFSRRMDELRLLLGSRSQLPPSVVRQSQVDHSGAEYHFGNITLTESQAKGMTVFDLARLSGALPIYGG